MRPDPRRWAVAALSLTLAACGSSQPPGSSPGAGVTITRTTYGIPHIRSETFGGLGLGYGYAFAEDNLCVLQEDLVTIRGERARYFGRDGSYRIVPNGNVSDNVSSDFFWKSQATDAVVARTRAATRADLREVSAGFVRGYNRYIRELKAGEHPGRHAACRDADWLFEIEEADMYRRYFRLGVLASSSVFVSEIANAQPPVTSARRGDGKAAATPALSPAEALRLDPGPLAFFDHTSRRFGSNMYALGAESTQDGSSMVFGNPHFPWTGPERLYLSHLTVPGQLDIMGVSLFGVPAVLIGFNNQVAWSHTVSTAYRFTFYELTLNPANPTQYFYDGALRDLEASTLTIAVKEADGSLSEESRTLYRSHYGPMLVLEVSGVPVLGWNNAKAYALRDANAENDRLINQFAAWNQAASLDEFIDLHGSVLGVPWVNTVASGPGGRAYYGDVTVVPHVTDEQVQTCSAQPIATAIGALVPGLPVLDGSRSACEWGSDPDAPVPGIFGRSNLPTLERDDWVHNCNDSYWLTNPAAPITGFDRIIGDEETERSLRTRQAIVQYQERMAGSDGLGAPGFTLPLLQEVTLSSALHSERLARASLLAELCPGASGAAAEACAALSAWDGRANLDSRGAHLWREFFLQLSGGADRGGDYWSTPFSAADPVNTPRDFNAAAQGVQEAFDTAVANVSASGFAFDAPLGEVQRPFAIEEAIPIFGGQFYEGAFTIADTLPLNEQGLRVDYGNSYIHTVTWENGQVRSEGFLTYSQSTDPANPHFADFTRAYSAKQWHRFPFSPAEIAAQKISEKTLSE
ncbi:MAG TPA: penicillin acylase family protein [Nevskiaceae bacterium]|nr:penicillin acylase family protein [Nevskiaceae bacterium]